MTDSNSVLARATPTTPVNGASGRSLSHYLPGALVALSLALGGYLRWSYVDLAEFGVDQQTALHYARLIRRGWDFPLVGMPASVGPYFGPGEYYVMALPQFFTDAPEVSALYMGLLGLIAGALFALTLWRTLGRWTAVAALGIFATGPWAVYFTRKIWTPDTLPLFSAALFGLLLLYLAGRRWWALPLASFVLGYMVQIHHSSVTMVPAVAVILLLFWRRLRPLPVALAAFTFLLSSSLYIWNALQKGPQELVRLMNLYSQPSQFDFSSLDLFGTLLSGARYVAGLGATYPTGVVVPEAPGAVLLMVGATVGGVAVVALDFWRTRSTGPLSTANVTRAVALVWVIVPLLVTIRHPFQLYLRYDLYLLPVAFVFPAAFFVALPRMARALGAAARPARWAPALAGLAVVYCVLAGALRVEAVHRTIDQTSFPLLGGPYDSYSTPMLRLSRNALDRIDAVLEPGRETVVHSDRLLVERGPLQYLNDNRRLLRFSDTSGVLILPPGKARFILLPDADGLAGVAASFGAVERKDLALTWPPRDDAARIFDLDAPVLPAGLSAAQPGQVLANGLELVSSGATTLDAQTFDVVTVWRLAKPEWAASPYVFYNAFAHVFDLAGNQLDLAGETELPLTAQWGTRDLFAVRFHLTAKTPVARGLYRLEAGVYVRNPARAPLPERPGAAKAATAGTIRLGASASAPAQAARVARFGDSLVLAAAKVNREGNVLRVDSTWQAQAAVPVDYTIFVHVYDAQGKLVAQKDGPPVNGTYPTSAWPAGEYVADSRSVELPATLPPGAYTVKLGLYDSKTIVRVAPTPDQGDRTVVVGTLEVGR